MREKYIKECDAIEQNCTYAAETHHTIASKQSCLSTCFQIVPAVAAAIIGVLVVTGQVPNWAIWLSVIAAVVSAVGSILNPLKEYYDHLNAAKNFTVIKHDARALRDTFSLSMNDNEFGAATKSIHDRYNDLVRFVPLTDTSSFEKARERVKGGVHKLD